MDPAGKGPQLCSTCANSARAASGLFPQRAGTARARGAGEQSPGVTPKPQAPCRPHCVWRNILVQKTEVLEWWVLGGATPGHRTVEGLQRGQRGSLASEPASALVPSWESSSRSARKAAITYTYPGSYTSSNKQSTESGKLCIILISTKLRSMKKAALT